MAGSQEAKYVMNRRGPARGNPLQIPTCIGERINNRTSTVAPKALLQKERMTWTHLVLRHTQRRRPIAVVLHAQTKLWWQGLWQSCKRRTQRLGKLPSMPRFVFMIPELALLPLDVYTSQNHAAAGANLDSENSRASGYQTKCDSAARAYLHPKTLS